MLRRTVAAFQRLIVTLAILGIVGALIAGWERAPELVAQIDRTSPDAQLNAITTTRAGLLALGAGLAALGTFWVNRKQLALTTRTFELTERGQITDRYATAITQLGNEKVEVRLGGLYALEQIANDSSRRGDEATVIEVLSSFVRLHASGPESGPDVRATIKVLGRLPNKGRASADFSHSNLSELEFDQGRFEKANFRGATINGASFRCTELREADFRGAELQGAQFQGSQAFRANFAFADLSNAVMLDANFVEVDLSNATVANARCGTEIGDMCWATDLNKAWVEATDFSGVTGLTQGDIDRTVCGTDKTRLPEGLRAPESWKFDDVLEKVGEGDRFNWGFRDLGPDVPRNTLWTRAKRLIGEFRQLQNEWPKREAKPESIDDALR